MGTNYYAIKKKPRIVKVYDSFHIGKSSGGWKFLFQDNENFHTFKEFKNWLLTQDEYKLVDEYKREISKEEFLEKIEALQKVENPDNFKYDRNVNGYRFNDGDFS